MQIYIYKNSFLFMKWKIGWLLFLVVFAFQCSHYDELQKNGKESKHGSKSSHYHGQDCMTCHNDPDNAASKDGGWWNIAGSIFNDDGDAPFTNATVELWSQPNRSGTLYYTLEVDGLGNFYTEKIVTYNGLCYPVVANHDNNDYEAMEPQFNSGGCNSCHGSSEDVITVD